MGPISLKYGNGTVSIMLPDRFRVDLLSPKNTVQPERDEAVIAAALNHPIGAPPLEALVRPDMKVAVIVDDLTRPTPIARMLPAVLGTLTGAGLSKRQITIVVALGTHRLMTDAELKHRLGYAVSSDYRVVNVDCKDRSRFVFMGHTSGGVPAWINRAVFEADLRVGLGMIVPHTDTGFSGGAKILLPGVCAHETIIAFHMRQVDGPPVRIGNEATPLRTELERFVAEKIPLDYILNLVLDVDERVYAAVSGHHIEAHRIGCRAAREVYGICVKKPYPVVIADAYPTQNDLWQSTKAISSAAAVTADGGHLIWLAYCPEGVGTHPRYAEYIGKSPETLRRMMAAKALPDPVAGALAYDIARVRKKIRISLVSSGLTKTDADAMGLAYFETLEAAVAHAHEAIGSSTIGILTHGGISWPYLAGSGIP